MDLLLKNRAATMPTAIWALIAAWTLMMVSLPIVKWTLGEQALLQGIVVGVLVQVVVVVAILWQAWGARRTVGTALTVVVLAWLAEAIGSTTGIPFGAYHYTDVLAAPARGRPPPHPFRLADDAAPGLGGGCSVGGGATASGFHRSQRRGIHRLGSVP